MKQTVRLLSLAVVVPLAAIAFAGAAWAADVETAPPEPAPPPDHEWTITVAPYFWMAGLDGDVGLFGQDPVEIHESFSDIIQDSSSVA